MINIAMKSKGSMNQNSILSINRTCTQNSYTAQNITGLNTPASQRNIDAQASVHAPAAPAAVRPARSTSAQTAKSTPAPSAAVQPDRQVQTPSAAQTARRSLPPLVKPVQKGQKAQLTAGGESLGILKACFGWNASNPQCDADVSAFLLGADGKVLGDTWFVFYGQTISPDKSCRFQMSQGADREIIAIDFQKLHTNVKKIVFVLTIHEAFAKRLHFGMMKDAYIRILDERGTECVSFQMTDYYSNVISMMIGEIYQYNGRWKFNAVGNGVAKDLAGLCALYGVEVND